jgi:hypothetical protein
MGDAVQKTRTNGEPEPRSVDDVLGPPVGAVLDREALKRWLRARPRVQRLLDLFLLAPTHRPPDDLAEYPVELCKRPTDIPLVKQSGIKHWFLRTPDVEAGMGPRGGGVPGDPNNPLTIRTTINDHTGQGAQPDSVCVPAGSINPLWEHEMRECIINELRIGRETGLWVPPFNDCHEVVKEILDVCRDPARAGGERMSMGAEPADGGVAP